MPALLEDEIDSEGKVKEKKIKRLIRVHDIGLVEVTLGAHNLSFRIPRTRTYVHTNWRQAIDSCGTPVNVQSYLMGHPFELLQNEVKKAEKRKSKAREKKDGK